MDGYFKKIAFMVVFGLASSCNNDEISLEKDLFPLKVGNSMVYDVIETNYSVANGESIDKYQIKESIGELISMDTYALLRYKRKNENESWSLDSVWKITKQSDKVVVSENNVSFIKAVLPIYDGLTWNGNALNNLDEELYTAKFIGEDIEITHKNDSNAISLNRRKEIYLPGKGMVYKEKTSYQYCQSSPDCIGKGIVTSGKSIIYKLSQ